MTHAQGADTLIGVLEDAADAGFATTFLVQEGAAITCGACQSRSSGESLVIDHYRRLEGASDAADMMLVAMTDCPTCGAAGTVTLGYGPNAGEHDAELLAALDLRDASPGPLP